MKPVETFFTFISSFLAMLSIAPAAAATIRVPADHATIQAAIDAASPGDCVLVAAGQYTERVTLKPGITLRSAGGDTKGNFGLARAEATVIDGGGDRGEGPGVAMAEGAALDGFTVTHVGRYDDEAWKHHHATHGNEQEHEHIGQPGTPGIGIVGVNCTVQHNIVHHVGSTGIAIQGVAGKTCSPRVVRNVCYRNMGGGIGSMSGSTAIIEANTCFQNFYAGIGHDNASPIVVGNACYENIRAGIGVSEGASPVVRGNKCYHNRRAGIGVRTGKHTRPVIEDNDCFENDMAGIGCDEHAMPIIRSNRCYNNAMAGIGCQNGAAPIIIDNDCHHNQSAGIGARDQAQPIIIANHSHENEEAGIGVRTKAHALIVGNRCIDNKMVAIGLPDGASAFIHQNQLSRQGGMPPLVAVREGARAVLTLNTLAGGGVAAVLVEGEVRLIGNTFAGAGPQQGSAVWVWKGSTVIADDNRFVGYRHAVNADDSAVHVARNTITGFTDAAIIVHNPSQKANIIGNRAYTAKANQQVVKIDGEGHTLADNAFAVELKESGKNEQQ